MANRTEFAAEGFAGGSSGALREMRLNDQSIDPKGRHRLADGERLTLIEAGGGGYGDPRERSRDAVLADLRDGFISAAAARDEYGVDDSE